MNEADAFDFIPTPALTSACKQYHTNFENIWSNESYKQDLRVVLCSNWRKIGSRSKSSNTSITALLNPLCKHTLLQLPSPNDHTLSLKIDALRVHCLYLPPSMPIHQVFDILESIPLLPNTIICGDFNARLGSLVGDHQTNPRGNRLLSWCSDRQLHILNETLAHGIATFTGSRLGQELSSIVDLFITNIAPSSLSNSSLHVESDLSLSSDHRLMTLSFDLDPLPDDVNHVLDRPLAPRRLWNLNKLKKLKPLQKYRMSIQDRIAPLQVQLEDWISSPPLECPFLDSFNDLFNSCVYDSLDDSIGKTRPRPDYWKKYWTQDLQDAASHRDFCYKRWRRSLGIDKVHWWNEHVAANKLFRQKVQKMKRDSWKVFKKEIEKNFSKAVKTISRIKHRNQQSSSFMHHDGPLKAVDIMSEHLSSVYNGSYLPASDIRPPPIIFTESIPHDVQDPSFLDADLISMHFNDLPNRKAPGPDHLKAEMLKPVKDLLSPFLSLYFQVCYQWSYTPSLWRQATVYPIFKKGDKSDPANYRPISLTSVLRKLFEMVISNTVLEFSPPLDHAQGGFRKRRSPLDQALCLHDLMHDYFRVHHHFPSVAFLDIKQAYDTVDRRVVWNSLASSSSFPRPLLNLLIHMFDDVSISVLLANHKSDPFTPHTGLLQGSVLSPHLYSLYINSLPGVLRSAASSSTTEVFGVGDSEPTPINSLLFADDVAIFGTRSEVQQMLDLAGQHSLQLGYRWSPSKCAILNAPSLLTSTALNFRFTLYNQDIPTVDQFTYLGMEFNKKGLYAAGNIEKRSAGAIQTMALLNSVGVNRNGFSLLLSARLYTTFIRPQFEYGLAISRFTASDMKKLDNLQNKLVGMFLGSRQTTTAKHITCIPGMIHRYNILVTKNVLRIQNLPEDSLIVLLQETLPSSRLVDVLENNALYTSLPDPVYDSPNRLRNHFRAHWQEYCDAQRIIQARNGTQVLLRACRPITTKPDPILYLPMNNSARSRLVRWRLGRFTAMDREECPYADFGAQISRDHFLTCRAIDPELISSLPVSPPGVNRIDFALSSLPTKAKSGPPKFWPALLTILWLIDTLCHPLKNIPEDPDPGSSWYNYPC
ncbi:hypothetical protein INT47_009495 [Mucor saturninus]|uniref:Reverse transcriptase domain-containing protein n=1 Tax=Mucor saturninus TaxID=64648 RepID=A0A8H7R7T1_9FUNG|nr:hypothetical protein INT47_009495 [Mucor saturninus]